MTKVLDVCGLIERSYSHQWVFTVHQWAVPALTSFPLCDLYLSLQVFMHMLLLGAVSMKYSLWATSLSVCWFLLPFFMATACGTSKGNMGLQTICKFVVQPWDISISFYPFCDHDKAEVDESEHWSLALRRPSGNHHWYCPHHVLFLPGLALPHDSLMFIFFVLSLSLSLSLFSVSLFSLSLSLSLSLFLFSLSLYIYIYIYLLFSLHRLHDPNYVHFEWTKGWYSDLLNFWTTSSAPLDVLKFCLKASFLPSVLQSYFQSPPRRTAKQDVQRICSTCNCIVTCVQPISRTWHGFGHFRDPQSCCMVLSLLQVMPCSCRQLCTRWRTMKATVQRKSWPGTGLSVPASVLADVLHKASNKS